MRENPAISDWVPISEGSTEGLLGGWLAQRQAALRGVVAAGRGLTSIVYRACRVALEHFVCQTSFWKSGMIRFERIAVRTDLESLRAANDHACLPRIPLNGSLLSYR